MKLLDTPDDIANSRSSKYVEVNTDEIFQAVLNRLKKQQTVLFIGLPCHIAAIKAFIPHSLHDNLITVEIICHGVPAQKSWQNYVDTLKKKYPSMIDFTFRKNDAWGYCETVVLADNTKIKAKQIYLSAFLKGFFTRESCFNCPYASKDRIADLTIGDFWYYPKPSNGGGVSYVSLNTETGLRFFEQVNPRFIVKTDKWKNAARDNGNLYKPSPRPDKKESAIRDWYNMPAEDFAEKYHLFPGFFEKIMSIPRRAIKKILKYIR
jgi:coenzyme F420-reducing hydrogenase beta subunit